MRIQRNLGEFKLKINMGLGSFFGDHQVHGMFIRMSAMLAALLTLEGIGCNNSCKYMMHNHNNCTIANSTLFV